MNEQFVIASDIEHTFKHVHFEHDFDGAYFVQFV